MYRYSLRNYHLSKTVGKETLQNKKNQKHKIKPTLFLKQLRSEGFIPAQQFVEEHRLIALSFATDHMEQSVAQQAHWLMNKKAKSTSTKKGYNAFLKDVLYIAIAKYSHN